jgi:hypothetical protein
LPRTSGASRQRWEAFCRSFRRAVQAQADGRQPLRRPAAGSRIHSLCTQPAPPSTAQAQRGCVRGLGGVGKSLLAEEYALRWRRLPGGIFWLRAFGNDPTRPTSAEPRSQARRQFAATAVALRIDTTGLQPAQVEHCSRKAD